MHQSYQLVIEASLTLFLRQVAMSRAVILYNTLCAPDHPMDANDLTDWNKKKVLVYYTLSYKFYIVRYCRLLTANLSCK